MQYFSLNRRAPITNFKNALFQSLAKDKGLYFPEKFTNLKSSFFDDLQEKSIHDIAYDVIEQFIVPEIPENILKEIIKETLSFNFPIRPLNNNMSILELFQGPTLAFKDVGARFMARCLGYFNEQTNDEITVLVATSGDTGGAVANGFLGVKGVNVVILYPSGKISHIQEKQLTTLGQNITALEVDGVFDDCQDMVKKAFVDEELNGQKQLTSANSINVARWLPQMFYYFFAYKELSLKYENLVFSVPSGNFGNVCAGMVAQKIGLPISHFIAANNSNDTVVNYMESQSYIPKSSVATLSNAMDVGNPSNFIRIQELYNNTFEALKANLSAYSFDDETTVNALKELYTTYGYIADPHGAIGYLGAKTFLKSKPNHHVIILETAHPAKFLDVVENIVPEEIKLPQQIKLLVDRKKRSIKINSYSDLKSYLLNN